MNTYTCDVCGNVCRNVFDALSNYHIEHSNGIGYCIGAFGFFKDQVNSPINPRSFKTPLQVLVSPYNMFSIGGKEAIKKAVREILNQGADPHISIRGTSSAYDIASDKGMVDILEIFDEHTFEIKEPGEE
jgi:undecaprenyl pyrophosphate synthase